MNRMSKDKEQKMKSNNINMDLETMMDKLRELGSEQIKNILMNHGIKEPLYGTKIGDLKKLVKYVKKNDMLARELYNTGNYDAMYLAGLSINPKGMTKDEVEAWLEKAYCSAISVSIVSNVAAESNFALELARKWIKSDNEIIESCGWSTISNYISITEDELIDMDEIIELLNIVETDINNSKNRVRYNMNGFVISVGVYIKELNERALEVAENIGNVKVDLGATSCKVPVAKDYIQKAISMNRIGRKRKSCIC